MRFYPAWSGAAGAGRTVLQLVECRPEVPASGGQLAAAVEEPAGAQEELPVVEKTEVEQPGGAAPLAGAPQGQLNGGGVA